MARNAIKTTIHHIDPGVRFNNNYYQERVRFNNNNDNNNNHYVLWRRCVFGRQAFTKERRYLPNFLGGGFSKLYQITPQTQLSRPITLGHYTSWSTDSASNTKVCDVTAAADKVLWEHLCVDTSFSWVPRWFGEQTRHPRAGDPMNDDPIIKCSPDVILCQVIKTSPMRLDLMVFWPWIQKSTKR